MLCRQSLPGFIAVLRFRRSVRALPELEYSQCQRTIGPRRRPINGERHFPHDAVADRATAANRGDVVYPQRLQTSARWPGPRPAIAEWHWAQPWPGAPRGRQTVLALVVPVKNPLQAGASQQNRLCDLVVCRHRAPGAHPKRMRLHAPCPGTGNGL